MHFPNQESHTFFILLLPCCRPVGKKLIWPKLEKRYPTSFDTFERRCCRQTIQKILMGKSHLILNPHAREFHQVYRILRVSMFNSLMTQNTVRVKAILAFTRVPCDPPIRKPAAEWCGTLLDSLSPPTGHHQCTVQHPTHCYHHITAHITSLHITQISGDCRK